MSIADWTGRLTTIGASANEVAAITAAYYADPTNVQQALDVLVGSLSNAGLLIMLNTWRSSGGPFEAGFPSGGLPFGTGVAVLTGNSGDDISAISAGTGRKLLFTTSRRQIALTARGLINETFDLEGTTGAGTIVNTQQIWCSHIGLAAGDVITNIVPCVTTAAAGTSPTLIRLAIVNNAGTVLASTANITGDANWTAIGLPQFPLSPGPFTIPANGGYYIAILQNGAYGTTPLQVLRLGGNTNGSVGQVGTGNRTFAWGGNGMTDITGTLTLTNPGGGICPWFGVN